MSKGMEVRQMSFKVEQIMTVTGIPEADASTFSVNIGIDENNLVVHLNPRFNWEGKNVVMVNSYKDGNWSDEVKQDFFPFHQGEEFKIIIQFTGFVMNLCGGSTFDFPNRLGAKKYTFFL